MNIKNLKNIARTAKFVTGIIGWKELKKLSSNQSGPIIYNPTVASEQKSVLVLAPHSDDEALACGGTLALMAKQDYKITVLYLTNGCHGTKDGRKNQDLIAIRQDESKKSLVQLGKIASIFWPDSDGSITATAKIKDRLIEVIDRLKPATIFAPWFGEDNADHQNVYKLALDVLKSQPKLTKEVWLYEVWSPLIPNRIVVIDKVVDKKTRAIEAHKSQLECRNYKDGILGLNSYRSAIYEAGKSAEAFIVLKTADLIEFDRKLARV